MYQLLRTGVMFSIVNHKITIINVLRREAAAIPIKSEMPTYRHQPRYCLKSPNTTGLMMIKKNNKRGYCSTSQLRLNSILFASRKESIKEAAKAIT